MPARIPFFAFLLLFFLPAAGAQQSSKSKSKDRFREKSDFRYPIRVYNATNLNKGGTELAPTYYESGVVFVSSRDKNGPRDPNTDETYNKLYFAPLDPSTGNAAKPSLWELDGKKKSTMHEGAVAFSRDWQTAYYTRNNNKNGVVKAGGRLKIYKAVNEKGQWTTVEEPAFNNDNYNCKHPSLSADGKRLYFSSDMPGGFGGFDLYVVEMTPEGWSKPQNLGAVVNTAKDETYPFIALSNTLFFSSNGRANALGGFDLYYINNPLDTAAMVINLDKPFNSPQDDVSLIIDGDSRSGFFASNREGGYGKMDIFRFAAEKGLEGLSKPETNPLLISVTNAKTGEPIQGASIRILQTTEDGTLVSGNKDYYTIDLEPSPDRPNVLTFKMERKGADELGSPDLVSNTAGRANYVLTRYRTYLILVSYDGFHPGDRYFFVETDKAVELNFPLSEAPFCVRAGGTVATEVNGTRLPGAVLKLMHPAKNYQMTLRTNLNGEFDGCLPLEGEWLAQVDYEGFRPEKVNFYANREKRPYNEIRLRSLKPEPVAAVVAAVPSPVASPGTPEPEQVPVLLTNVLREGAVVVMEEVFYEQNKFTLNARAVRHMDALFEQLMKRYPNMEIDLVVHTDTRGDARQNQLLSDQRAVNAKAYLEYKGVPEGRINAYGKGESEPRNRCVDGVDCSPQEHAKNNRIEVRVRRLN